MLAKPVHTGKNVSAGGRPGWWRDGVGGVRLEGANDKDILAKVSLKWIEGSFFQIDIK